MLGWTGRGLPFKVCAGAGAVVRDDVRVWLAPVDPALGINLLNMVLLDMAEETVIILQWVFRGPEVEILARFVRVNIRTCPAPQTAEIEVDGRHFGRGGR